MHLKKLSAAILCAVSSLIVGGLRSANAGPVFESELVGTATNNTIAGAQAIPGASFTTPVPPTVFNPPGWATATIFGHGGGNDVDFFSFSTPGGGALFDIDNNPFTFDSILSLFNSSGTLIAYDDDSFPADPGSAHYFDAFVGTITLLPGDYFVAVSQFANFPTATSSPGITHTSLTRPDGAFGGWSVSGVTPGDCSFRSSGVDQGSAYTLHISLENVGVSAIPEPSSLALLGIGVVSLFGYGWRRKSAAAAARIN